MPDSTAPAPSPAPDAGGTTDPNLSVAPAPESGGSEPSLLNQAQLREISRAEHLVAKAQDPLYATTLANRINDPAFLPTLTTDCALARSRGARAVVNDSQRQDATRTEGAAERTLVNSLREIQSSASLQHLPEHPDLLGPYFVGQRMDTSRPMLEAASRNILERAEEERPPGVDTDVIVRVTGERDAYVQVEGTQAGAGARAKQERVFLRDLVRSITERRKKIQRAADAAWPHHKPESAQARADFQLPATRRYSY
jgi:hypothetical protein